MTGLHCGACWDSFENGAELMTHHNSCNAARVLLMMVWIVWGGTDHIHKTAAFIVSVRKSTPLIRKYAWAVANDIDTIKRAEIHMELCDNLGLSRKDFQPFESSEIKEIPDQKRAESIIWNAIRRVSLENRQAKNSKLTFNSITGMTDIDLTQIDIIDVSEPPDKEANLYQLNIAMKSGIHFSWKTTKDEITKIRNAWKDLVIKSLEDRHG